MIVIRLSSGLGNQLFMYAFYKYIEKKYNQVPYFDDKYFIDHRGIIRKSELSILYPDYPVYKFKFNPAGERRLRGYICRWKQKILPSLHFVNEADYDDSKLYTGDIYFNGYWQTAKYVKQLDAAAFEPTEIMPSSIKDVLTIIKDCKCPVSIHFRRGDYFMPKWIGRYGVCNNDYYHSSLQKLRESISDEPLYFVFSDDLGWVRENINFNGKHVIVPNIDVNSFWYIYLMSHCKHNIISNSTFSWWGAYLNKNKDKVVIGPSKWMLDSNVTLMQPEWIKVEV